MRIVVFAASAALAASLSACASTGTGSYASEVERLAAECQARGGILTPSGTQTGRPQVDNLCRISGQPSSRIGG